MQENNAPRLYRIWGIDNVAYGPVELPTLILWVQEERVLPGTWVYTEPGSGWTQAAAMTELKEPLAIRSRVPPQSGVELYPSAVFSKRVRPGTLRRIKLFADMEERQIESFINYMEITSVKQFAHVVRKGDFGDAMYLILEGELRAYVLVDEKECTLSTMGVGEFFGEISLLDEGPRSAEVVANTDSLLLKISAANFVKMIREAPGLGTHFLLSLSRSVVSRVRSLTKRYQDSIHFLRLLGASH